MKFLSLLFALLIGVVLIQPAYASNAIIMEEIVTPSGIMFTADYAVAMEFDYVLQPILMVASAVIMPSHLNNKIDTLIEKSVMPLSEFKEVETVLKSPYLLPKKQEYQKCIVGLVVT